MPIQIQSQNSSSVNSIVSKDNRVAHTGLASFNVRLSDKNEPKAPLKVKLAALVTALTGVTIAMSHLLKKKGVDLKSFESIKKGLWNIKYHEEEIFKIAVGSVLGGLAGGALADKKENFNAKLRESVIQFVGNIMVPLGCVALATRGYKNYLKTPIEKALPNYIKNIPSLATTAISLCIGIFSGNKVGNAINKDVFCVDDNRTLKLTDMAPHVDDACFALAMGNDSNPWIHKIARIIPLALTVAGVEVGEAQEKPERVCSKKEQSVKPTEVTKTPEQIKLPEEIKELEQIKASTNESKSDDKVAS